jgi:ABC-type uncharacterized transport system substrate-binding protein
VIAPPPNAATTSRPSTGANPNKSALHSVGIFGLRLSPTAEKSTAGGGLMSYGIDTPDLFRRTAGYLDRVLKGEKPGSLPVQAPNNSHSSSISRQRMRIGLDVPSALIARADEVIE